MWSSESLPVVERVRALTAAVRALPDPTPGAGAVEVGEALLELDTAVRAALVGVVAVVDADGVLAEGAWLNARTWLRARGKCSDATAGTLVSLARRLASDPVRPLPVTAAALEAGDVTFDQAAAVAKATAGAPAEVVPELEATLVARATHLSASRLQKVGEHLVEQLATQLADGPDARERELGGCYQRTRPSLFGRLAVDGVLSPEAGALLLATLDPHAAPVATTGADGLLVRDPRTPGERLHDAFTEVLRLAAGSDAQPGQGGSAPHVEILVDADTLLAAAASAAAGEQDPGRHAAPMPSPAGHSPDGLPLSWSAVAEVSCDARVSWTAVRPGASAADLPAVGIDPEALRRALATISPALGGLPLEVLAAGRATRLVTTAQRRALVARDRGCVVPGCGAPARRCHAHHVVHWAHGGATDLSNLALVCPAHHRFLHERGWSLRRDPSTHLWLAQPPPGIDTAA